MAVAGPTSMKQTVHVPLYQQEQKATGQSVGAPNENSLHPDNSIVTNLHKALLCNGSVNMFQCAKMEGCFSSLLDSNQRTNGLAR
jgi:hypothetical protein